MLVTNVPSSPSNQQWRVDAEQHPVFKTHHSWHLLGGYLKKLQFAWSLARLCYEEGETAIQTKRTVALG